MATTSLLTVFATTILLVMFMAKIGYVLGRRTDLDPLNTVVLYALLPDLIFTAW